MEKIKYQYLTRFKLLSVNSSYSCSKYRLYCTASIKIDPFNVNRKKQSDQDPDMLLKFCTRSQVHEDSDRCVLLKPRVIIITGHAIIITLDCSSK